MKQLDVVAGILVVVGALNWGLVALAQFDLVAATGRQLGERLVGRREDRERAGALEAADLVQTLQAR